jgi:hypothetical protein
VGIFLSQYSTDTTTTDGHSSDIRLSVEDENPTESVPVKPAFAAANVGGGRQEKKPVGRLPSVPATDAIPDREDQAVTGSSHQLNRRRRRSGPETKKKTVFETNATKKKVP